MGSEIIPPTTTGKGAWPEKKTKKKKKKQAAKKKNKKRGGGILLVFRTICLGIPGKKGGTGGNFFGFFWGGVGRLAVWFFFLFPQRGGGGWTRAFKPFAGTGVRGVRIFQKDEIDPFGGGA